ncbi:hypothetical protein BW721_07365 [Jeotgalibaca sp. PTS2502]|uniref:glycosyltransferase family 2 protein n=1 Tax=Jeotgalibaca sp. PTS2502 TaxID=1903686 RepID=UPI000973B1AD|nr:glycosyltransferase family 2 protein [Jeotgalibaca sp. PTS2502]APZ49504.1 hypothetical protein BW721_07365 [Jeotgalibaca sp. PTS2502]
MFSQSVVVIPAFNPSNDLILYAKQLIDKGVPSIIIVNDGSKPEHQAVFDQLAALPACQLLVHEVNRGKGRALKTAFSYIKEQQLAVKTIVTADADGQHVAEDVMALITVAKGSPNTIVLGVRDFDQDNVPSKNAFGNKLTSRVVALLFGTYISDTQTGLRAFDFNHLDWLLDVSGDRFEYEMNVLTYALIQSIPIHEQAIQTIYFGGESSSHYKALTDSLRIAKQLLRGFIFKKRFK